MPGNWEVRVTERALREQTQLPREIREESKTTIEDLGDDPFPPGAEALEGYNNEYRIRIGSEAYRILYRVDTKRRLVVVYRIRPRPTAYKGMKKPRS
ncbi:MAG: type II toxin-antitoxin system RelE/ParE family toxin [Acidobacteriota bacterium]